MVLSRDALHGRQIKWPCRCDCGSEAIVLGANMRSGRSKSCACLNKEVASANAAARWSERRAANNAGNTAAGAGVVLKAIK